MCDETGRQIYVGSGAQVGRFRSVDEALDAAVAAEEFAVDPATENPQDANEEAHRLLSIAFLKEQLGA